MVSGLLVPALAAAEVAPAWPQFRGPERDDVSRETGLMKSWPEGGPALAWTASGCGEGFATVAIQDGTICTAGRFGKECRIVSLTLDGKPKWAAANGEEWGRDYPGSRGTPTLTQDRLYHLNGNGRLGCFETATGKELWSVNTVEQFRSQPPRWGFSESVLVAEGKVICTPGGPDAALAALDPQTGSTLWTTTGVGETAGYCSAIVLRVDGRAQVVTMLAKSVVGVDLATGKLLWRHPHETSYDVNCPTPLCRDGQVYVTTGYGTGGVLLKITRDGDSCKAVEVWRNRKLDNQHGGVVLVNGFIFGSGHNANQGAWTCLDFATGKEQYTDRGVGKGSVTCADGMLLCLSENGAVGLMTADPAATSVVGRFSIPKGGQGPVWAHPVVCGGRLYIRHGDNLYAYDINAR
jgi:outer membrane protein assembly factor BamB